MQKEIDTSILNYEVYSSRACNQCERDGKGLVPSHLVVIWLKKDDYCENFCLSCFMKWTQEMEEGKHGLFQFYQILTISRPSKSLKTIKPHESSLKKNVEALR